MNSVEPSRSFAIVPAAGRSVRMGAPKLLLPVAGRPLIDHVLAAWSASRSTRIVVVVRGDDHALATRCRQFPVELLRPQTTPEEMCDSVRLALDHLTSTAAPADDDAVLLAPADLPGLSAAILDRMLGEYESSRPHAVVPVVTGRRGHPLVLSWSAAQGVYRLAPHEGVNALVARLPLREIAWPLPDEVCDMDTRDDYARLLRGPDETAPGAAGFQLNVPPPALR